MWRTLVEVVVRRPNIVSLGVVFLHLVLMPAAAVAQNTGIAGRVNDASGAVLPGVTVEASSPALIERVRSVVTDGQGLYQIVDLRPGLYTVTFSLPGFTTVKREGIELTGSFTATVNTELKVGSLEETVTVTGQSPTVDTRNVVQQKVLTTKIMEALPSARNITGLGAVIPGVSTTGIGKAHGQDVGGLAGERGAMVFHGSRSGDFTSQLDGLSWQLHVSTGQLSSFTLNPGEAEEFVYELGALSAENESGGVRVNVIPKEGGNSFRGTFLGDFATSGLQSKNLDADLINRGLQSVNGLDKNWDVNPSFGGPIKESKLWFFASYRYWGTRETVAGLFAPVDPLAFVYVPDLSRQVLQEHWLMSAGLRLTWQATNKNKFSVYGVHQPRCYCTHSVTATRAKEAAYRQVAKMNNVSQVSWKSTPISRFLLDVSAMFPRNNPQLHPQPGTEGVISTRELRTGLQFRAVPNYDAYLLYTSPSSRAALSYVTGSHAAKVGVDFVGGYTKQETWVNGDVAYTLLDGLPRSITVFNTPRLEQLNVKALGFYAQDQWTLKRLTLNGGLRLDYFNGNVPAQHMGAGRWVPDRNFAPVSDVPDWKDLSPRLGVAYDLSGNGNTALKVTAGRYVVRDRVSFSGANNPVNANGTSATRTWNDRNGDYIPQEDELGPLSNAAFGTTALSTTHYDDAIRSGWGVRPYHWEISTSVQHELLPQVSVNVAYTSRWYGNFTTTDNLKVTPADFDEYCVVAPVDSRLPGGGGDRICGLYDLNPGKFGLVDNLVTSAKNYGTQTDTYNGIDVTMSIRFPRGLVSGGVNSGSSLTRGNSFTNSTDECFVVDSPQLRFCDIDVPWQTQVKALGTVGLPWDIQVGATFQSIPGPEIVANATFTSAQTTLGRNLNTGTVSVPLIAPATLFGDRMYQLDARLTKIFRVNRSRIKGILNLFNTLNSNAVLTQNNTYGSNWLRPTYVLPGRFLRLGVQVDF